MFETIVTRAGNQISTYKRSRSFLISIVGHSVIVISFLALPFFGATGQLPKPPVMLAYVALPAPPPPPPPPPAPAASSPQTTKRMEELSQSEFAAPIDVPDEIVPESGLARGVVGGTPGGVEGGVPGGVMGGVLGGLPSEAPPPPPPPPAPVKAVRVGGEISQPALLQRVPPEYPEVALLAQLQGLVILEATVDTEGRVEAVRVLRSVGLLDDAAIDAVRQWRYSPLRLNGVPTPFILTVTVAFELDG